MNVFGVTKYEKKIATFFRNKREGNVLLYDGKQITKMSPSEFSKEWNDFYHTKFKYIQCKKEKNLEKTRNEFIRDTNLLKQVTGGQINMYKTGSVSQTALHLFGGLNTRFNPENISMEESEWISYSTKGALMHAQEYVGEAWKFDICSMYPSIMRSNNMLFPYEAGVFMNLTEFGQDFATAIYRCKIDIKDSRLFRLNDRNYYTSHDVRRARELNFPIQLIQDGKYNALIYPRSSCVTGQQLFGPFIDLLFDLKKNYKIPLAKEIMNSLWGALSQAYENHLVITSDHPTDVPIWDDSDIIITPRIGSKKLDIKVFKKDTAFRNDWARIKPFLLAKSRSMISKIMEPHINNIVRCHTDGIVSSCPLPIPTGDELGQIKYEGYCPMFSVYKVNNIKGKFLVVDSWEQYMDQLIAEHKPIVTELDHQIINGLKVGNDQ